MRKVVLPVLFAALGVLSACASSEQVETSGPDQLRSVIDSFVSDPAVSALTEGPPSGADLAAACDSVVPAITSLQTQLQEARWPDEVVLTMSRLDDAVALHLEAADKCASGVPGAFEEFVSSAELLTKAETDAMTALQTGTEFEEVAAPSPTVPPTTAPPVTYPNGCPDRGAVAFSGLRFVPDFASEFGESGKLTGKVTNFSNEAVSTAELGLALEFYKADGTYGGPVPTSVTEGNLRPLMTLEPGQSALVDGFISVVGGRYGSVRVNKDHPYTGFGVGCGLIIVVK